MIPYLCTVIRTPWATELFSPTGRPCIATIEPKGCEWAILIDDEGVPEIVAVGEVAQVLERRAVVKRERERPLGIPDVHQIGDDVVVVIPGAPHPGAGDPGAETVYRGKVRTIIVEEGDEISYDVAVPSGENDGGTTIVERLPARMVYTEGTFRGRNAWAPPPPPGTRRPRRREPKKVGSVEYRITE